MNGSEDRTGAQSGEEQSDGSGIGERDEASAGFPEAADIMPSAGWDGAESEDETAFGTSDSAEQTERAASGLESESVEREGLEYVGPEGEGLESEGLESEGLEHESFESEGLQGDSPGAGATGEDRGEDDRAEDVRAGDGPAEDVAAESGEEADEAASLPDAEAGDAASVPDAEAGEAASVPEPEIGTPRPDAGASSSVTDTGTAGPQAEAPDSPGDAVAAECPIVPERDDSDASADSDSEPEPAAAEDRTGSVPEPDAPSAGAVAPAPGREGFASAASANTGKDSPAAGQRMRRRWGAAVGIGAAVVVLGGYFGLALWQSRALPASAHSAGVDLGGMDAPEAVAALEPAAEDALGEEIVLETGTAEVALSPETAGLALDPQATVDSALGFSADPRVVWERLFGDDEIPPVLAVDEERFAPALDEASTALSEEPVDAELAISDGEAVVSDSAEGLVVTPESLRTVVQEQWLRTDGPLALEPETTAPAVTTEAAQRAKEEIADPALSGDISIEAAEDDETHTLTVSQETVGATLGFEPEDGALVPVFDEEELRDAVFEANPEVGRPAEDASFEISGSSLTVVPSRAGVGAEPAELASAVEEAMVSASRTSSIELTETEPDFTTEEAEAADFSSVVSEFSTPYASSPNRDANLRVSTERVRGTVLQPGEQFSLNEALGERTAAAGYRPAGVISGGQMKEDYGGGVSQTSTTLFNAAFFAGFSLDEHQAHSRYISRYPEGRETTLDWTSIDLKFTNTLDAPVVLDMHLEGGEVVARVFGAEEADVEASSSGRFAYTSPGTVRESGPRCTPQAPAQGWSVTIYRTIKDPDSGAVVSEDDFTTVYRPVNRVVCED